MNQDILLLVVGILALVLVLAIALYPRLRSSLKAGKVELTIDGDRRPEPETPKAGAETPKAGESPAAPQPQPAISVGRDLKGPVAIGPGSIAGGKVKVGKIVVHGAKDSDD